MKKPTMREILTSSMIVVIIVLFFSLNLTVPSPDMLIAERRVPTAIPRFDIDRIVSGSFTSQIDNWAADNFVFRDKFRSINSFYVFKILGQSDKDGLYHSESGLGKIKRIENKNYEHIAKKIIAASDIFDGFEMNYYYSIIPDKAEFEKGYRPGFSETEAINIISDILVDFTNIFLTGSLDADSYYKTDLHWDQSMISETAQVILTAMGEDSWSGNFTFAAAGEFYGVYAGEYALPILPDTMIYADLHGLSVSYLDSGTMEMSAGLLYDMERFKGIDPYDFFLQGPQPLVVIENTNTDTITGKKELYMFRDSYGSSIAPLLTGVYSKIVLIDLRYIHINELCRYIELRSGSDVLFIYSSQILGNPHALQS